MSKLSRLGGALCLAALGAMSQQAWAGVASPNPGDPLFCQPNEGATFLIVNDGTGVLTVDGDCYNNSASLASAPTTITTAKGGTLAGTASGSQVNYVYTPPSAGFSGLDTFSIPVTTVWNGAGGAGSAGGAARPGGPATLAITLNVLPAPQLATVMSTPLLIPVPTGAVSACTVPGNSAKGPAASDVTGCPTAVSALSSGQVNPSHGTLTATGSSLLYTPTAGYVGTDTFTYQVLGVNTDGQTALSSGAVNATVNVGAAPAVTSIAPSSGAVGGGTSVVITGTNLNSVTKVMFGTVAATSFKIDSATQITAVAPAGSAGNVDVTVGTAGTMSVTSSADQFTYQGPSTTTTPAPAATPTVGEWGLILVALSIGMLGVANLRQRRA